MPRTPAGITQADIARAIRAAKQAGASVVRIVTPSGKIEIDLRSDADKHEPKTRCSKLEVSMPRPRPPHIHRQISRHGKTNWYFRVGHGPRIRLPVGPGEAGFDEAYAAALAGKTPTPLQHTGPRRDTFAWAVARYRETAEWLAYDEATRKARDQLFTNVIAKAGGRPLSSFTTAVIEAGVGKRKPGAAWGYLGALRPFFK